MELVSLKIAILQLILAGMITWIQTKPLRKESRLSLVDWTSYNAHEPQGPGTYAFGYDVEDPESNNIQFRDEERYANGTVTGSYGLLQPDGNVHIVHYVADEKGYRVNIETYPRGQLKPVGIPDISSALASAIQSRETYKKQTVHEQRLRPTDMRATPKPYAQTGAKSFLKSVGNDHSNNVYDSYNEILNNGHKVAVDPYRFIFNRT